MKRTMLTGLATVLLLPLISIAQEQNPSNAAYLKWRDETLAQRPAGINTPHHAMATTLTRLSPQTLNLAFTLVGNTSSHELLIQPLKSRNQADGHTEREKVGEVMTVSVGLGGRNEAEALGQVLQKVDVQAGEEANEIQITWTFELEGTPFTSIHYLGFGEVSPVTSVVGIER